MATTVMREEVVAVATGSVTEAEDHFGIVDWGFWGMFRSVWGKRKEKKKKIKRKKD